MIGLALPHHIASPYEYVIARPPADGDHFKVSWQCVPDRRGRYPLKNCYLGARSPLGFWSAKKAVPVPTELRVYPNLHPERRNLAALFLNRGTLGIHAQRQVGKGREFEKLREYIHGDSYEDIHWKATAKRGRPVTKVFQIERTQEVYLAIDASRLSARVPPRAADAEPEAVPTTVLDRYLTAALIMGLVAERQGDLFGLLTFSDRIHGFVRAKNGTAHYDACRDMLYTMQPRIVTPDFDEVLTFIRLHLRRRALVVFLTHLDDPALADSFVERLDLICRQHLVLVNTLVPPYIRPLFSSDDITESREMYENLVGHLLWQKIGELEKTLGRRGVHLSLLENETMCTQLVSQYISVKRRQLL
jgi:uncharacterized protein (DUF58 family)